MATTNIGLPRLAGTDPQSISTWADEVGRALQFMLDTTSNSIYGTNVPPNSALSFPRITVAEDAVEFLSPDSASEAMGTGYRKYLSLDVEKLLFYDIVVPEWANHVRILLSGVYPNLGGGNSQLLAQIRANNTLNTSAQYSTQDLSTNSGSIVAVIRSLVSLSAAVITPDFSATLAPSIVTIDLTVGSNISVPRMTFSYGMNEVGGNSSGHGTVTMNPSALGRVQSVRLFFNSSIAFFPTGKIFAFGVA